MEIAYILADKDDKGEYCGTEFSVDKDSILYNLEYGDVVQGIYQLWEYPSGDVNIIKSDRTLPHDDYSTPSPNKWLPVLEQISKSESKVTEAYLKLSNQG